MPSSQKLQIWLKPNCAWMFIEWSSTKYPFFILIWTSKWRLRQDLVYHWTLWEKCFKTLLLWNHLDSWNQTAQGWNIGRSSTKFLFFYADRKSKMAANTGHSINTGPYGENTEICSSLKLLYWLNLNCASIIGRFFTNFVFYMLIGIPRWLPLQDIVFT
jgi:hypothetical protein